MDRDARVMSAVDAMNACYGADVVLAAAAGVEPAPIPGDCALLLQHGWAPGDPFAGEDQGDARRAVWSASNLVAARAAHPRATFVAIGAPFLYAVAASDDVDATRGRGVVFYPTHNDVGHAQRLADELAAVDSSATVVLRPYDAEQPGIVNAYTRRGATIASHGTQRSTTFLTCHLQLLLEHATVAANHVGTALFNGGAVGLEMRVLGETPDIACAAGTPVGADVLAAWQDEHWSQLYAGLVDVELARHELGADSLRTAGELLEILWP